MRIKKIDFGVKQEQKDISQSKMAFSFRLLLIFILTGPSKVQGKAKFLIKGLEFVAVAEQPFNVVCLLRILEENPYTREELFHFTIRNIRTETFTHCKIRHWGDCPPPAVNARCGCMAMTGRMYYKFFYHIPNVGHEYLEAKHMFQCGIGGIEENAVSKVLSIIGWKIVPLHDSLCTGTELRFEWAINTEAEDWLAMMRFAYISKIYWFYQCDKNGDQIPRDCIIAFYSNKVEEYPGIPDVSREYVWLNPSWRDRAHISLKNNFDQLVIDRLELMDSGEIAIKVFWERRRRGQMETTFRDLINQTCHGAVKQGRNPCPLVGKTTLKFNVPPFTDHEIQISARRVHDGAFYVTCVIRGLSASVFPDLSLVLMDGQLELKKSENLYLSYLGEGNLMAYNFSCRLEGPPLKCARRHDSVFKKAFLNPKDVTSDVSEFLVHPIKIVFIIEAVVCIFLMLFTTLLCCDHMRMISKSRYNVDTRMRTMDDLLAMAKWVHKMERKTMKESPDHDDAVNLRIQQQIDTLQREKKIQFDAILSEGPKLKKKKVKKKRKKPETLSSGKSLSPAVKHKIMHFKATEGLGRRDYARSRILARDKKKLTERQHEESKIYAS